MMVIDISGSMGGEKIKLVKETLLFLVDELKAKDRLGLIIFDDRVDVLKKLTYMTSTNKNAFKKAIEKIKTRGSTNIGLAIETALKQLLSRKEVN